MAKRSKSDKSAKKATGGKKKSKKEDDPIDEKKKPEEEEKPTKKGGKKKPPKHGASEKPHSLNSRTAKRSGTSQESVPLSSKDKSSKKGKKDKKGKKGRKGRRGRRRGRGRKKKDIEYIDENIYSQADDIIYDKIDSKGKDAVRVLVSDEVFNPAGSDVVEYGEAKIFNFSETTKEFALDDIKVLDVDPLENVEVLDIEKTVKVIDVDGKELREQKPKKGRKGRRGRRDRRGHRRKKDRPKRKIIDESKLEYDPLEQIHEYKKNWDQYQIKCKVCQNSQRCQVCQGTGRRFILLRCKNCDGKGRCPSCHRTYSVKCMNCKEEVLNYSPRCLYCAHENRCPKCFTPIPVAATICIVCRTKFICRRCKLPIAPGFEKRCPRCDAKVEQALY
jgi:hypothetical protein